MYVYTVNDQPYSFSCCQPTCSSIEEVISSLQALQLQTSPPPSPSLVTGVTQLCEGLRKRVSWWKGGFQTLAHTIGLYLSFSHLSVKVLVNGLNKSQDYLFLGERDIFVRCEFLASALKNIHDSSIPTTRCLIYVVILLWVKMSSLAYKPQTPQK